MSTAASIFDTEADRYDAWFDTPDGRVLFGNELQAIRLLWRDDYHPTLEVGVGTGRFAQALGVEFGIDPAAGSLRLAEQRGIKVTPARGEALPFADGSFAGVLVLTTLCFADDAPALIREAARVLRPDGHLLIGDIPADSPFRIAANLARNHHRWRERHPSEPLDALQHGSFEPASESATPDAALSQADTTRAVRLAVRQLPDDLRETFVLFSDEDMSHAEIADILNCTPKAVETRIYRARQILKVKLADLLPK